MECSHAERHKTSISMSSSATNSPVRSLFPTTGCCCGDLRPFDTDYGARDCDIANWACGNHNVTCDITVDDQGPFFYHLSCDAPDSSQNSDQHRFPFNGCSHLLATSTMIPATTSAPLASTTAPTHTTSVTPFLPTTSVSTATVITTTTAAPSVVDTVTNVTLVLRISGTQWALVLNVSYAAAVSSVALDIAISLNVPVTSIVIHSLSVGSLIVNSSVDAAALTSGGVVTTAQLSSPTIVQDAVQSKASTMSLEAVSNLHGNTTNVTGPSLSLASVSVTSTVVKTTSGQQRL